MSALAALRIQASEFGLRMARSALPVAAGPTQAFQRSASRFRQLMQSSQYGVQIANFGVRITGCCRQWIVDCGWLQRLDCGLCSVRCVSGRAPACRPAEHKMRTAHCGGPGVGHLASGTGCWAL
eukprot:2713487-Alexandrium_andersonii.AAC.1